MNHYRKTIKKYRARQRSADCPFCDKQTRAKAVYEDKFLYVVPNLTRYDLWEGHEVKDHLLIVPKRHVEKLGDMTKEERLALIDKIADYESDGYSAYARGSGFIKRSVDHQHTHVIKVSNKSPRIVLFIRSPYYLLRK